MATERKPGPLLWDFRTLNKLMEERDQGVLYTQRERCVKIDRGAPISAQHQKAITPHHHPPIGLYSSYQFLVCVCVRKQEKEKKKREERARCRVWITSIKCSRTPVWPSHKEPRKGRTSLLITRRIVRVGHC